MKLRRILAPTLFGLFGIAILISLGVWQVHRLAWKEGLIHQIETRLAAEPVPLPETPDPVRDKLLRVTATGRIGTPEIDVLSSVQPWGVGYRVIRPMTLANGRRVMVDLGFVPDALKDPAKRPDDILRNPDRPPDTLTGMLLWPNETDSWTPEPDLGRNIWFARNVPEMAKALDTRPVLIVAEKTAEPKFPLPQPPGADLPNNHLEYAITWFGLAAVWAIMSVLWLRDEALGRRRPIV